MVTLKCFFLRFSHADFILCKQVLYRFLEYYGTFDWDNYCISINGPIALSSLAEIMSKLCIIVSIYCLVSTVYEG